MIKQTAITAMLAIAALGFSGLAVSQNGTGTASAQQQQAQQLIQKLRQKATKLRQIHAETLKANPDLRQQQKEFRAMVRAEIEDQGYDIKAGNERVASMADKLQSGNLSKAERRAILKDYAAERRALSQAKAAALQQPKIRKAGKQLQQATLAAMKAHSDRVEALLQDMKRIRKKLRSLMDSASAN